jgi:hypothetical protein
MSKAEILAALPALAPSERQEIIQQLWDLEEIVLLRGAEPSPEVKAVLNQALEEYRRSPDAGRPWREVLAGLRESVAA